MAASWGANEVSGVVSRFEFGNSEILVVNVTKEFITYDKAVYTRAVGGARGAIEGTNQTFDGRAFFDEFTYGLAVA